MYSYMTVTEMAFSFSKSILVNFSQGICGEISSHGCKMASEDHQQIWDVAHRSPKDACPLPTLLNAHTKPHVAFSQNLEASVE